MYVCMYVVQVLVLNVVTDNTAMLGVSGHGCELQLAHREMSNLITPAQHSRFLDYKTVVRSSFQYRNFSHKWYSRVSLWQWYTPLQHSKLPLQTTPSVEMCHTDTSSRQNNLLQAPHTPQDTSNHERGSRSAASSDCFSLGSVQVVPEPCTQVGGGGGGAVCSQRPIAHNEGNRVQNQVCCIKSIQREGVYPHLHGLDSADQPLQDDLTARSFELLRLRTSLRGDILQTIVNKMHHAASTADDTMIFFKRPMAALHKKSARFIVILAGLWFILVAFNASQHGFTEYYFTTRHLRFSVLQTRSRQSAEGVSISRIGLKHNDCLVTPEGMHSMIEDTSLLITLPHFQKLNGWTLTSSTQDASEPADPVRFTLEYAKIETSSVDQGVYTLAQCLFDADALSADEQRSAVVEELVKRPGSWCATRDVDQCEALSDAELLRLCLPAQLIRQEDWRVISASKCRWGVNQITCLPRSNQVFTYFSLERGFTHTFDLRPPWYIFLSVLWSYIPPIIFCIACPILATLGHFEAARACIGLASLLPGILEFITAIAIVTR